MSRMLESSPCMSAILVPDPRSKAMLPTLNPVRGISQLHLLVRADDQGRLFNWNKLGSRIVHGNDVKNKPDRTKPFEGSLCPVARYYRDKKAQSEPAKLEIPQKLEACFSKSCDEQPYQHGKPDQSQVQIGFKIAIVGLGGVPPVLPPQRLQPFSQPETFKSRSEDWIGI